MVLERLAQGPYLCLSHNQGEDRVRSGALVIHSCSCCSSLLVAKVQPPLNQQRHMTFSVAQILNGII